MLDLERRLALPDFPEVSVFRDHEHPRTYYVIPQAAAVETDDGGGPEARLLLYVKRQGNQKLPSGGQISLTTILRTPPAELARIKKAIETRLTEPPPAPAPPPVVVRLAAPEWVAGNVTVVLTPSLTLSGAPSLFGDNRCALMGALTAEQALEAREQWGRKLPDASIVYDMVMRVASTTAGPVSLDAEAVFGRADGTAHAASAGTRPIALKGRVWMDGLERRLTEIDLTP